MFFLCFILQLLSDIVSVSEATDWSSDCTAIAKYRALGCHIKLVNQSIDAENQSADDAADIQEVMSSIQEMGGKVCNVYRVRRTEEEVNFQANFGNVKTLTHCSAATNYLGILSRYSFNILKS